MAERRAPRPVTSLTNETVKAIRALEMRKERRDTGLFVAEGAAILITARDHGFLPETLVMLAGATRDGIAAGLVTSALAGGTDVIEATTQVMTKLAAKDNPQTLLATFRQRWAALPTPTAAKPTDTWVLLEEVRDPGNLGTIIRTADAVGAAGIVLAGTCCDPWSRECVRASMGSIFAVPLARGSREEAIALARSWRGDVVATHLDATHDFRHVDYRGPVMLVMGGEGPGLTDELAAVATRRVKIPMAGKLDSLNLAVATALALYQIRGPQLEM